MVIIQEPFPPVGTIIDEQFLQDHGSNAADFIAIAIHWRDAQSPTTSNEALLALLQRFFYLMKGVSGADATAVPVGSWKQLVGPFLKHVHMGPQRWCFCGHCPESTDEGAEGRHIFKFEHGGVKLVDGEDAVCPTCQYSCILGQTDTAGNVCPFAAPVHCGDFLPFPTIMEARFADPLFAELAKRLAIPAAPGETLDDWFHGWAARLALAQNADFFADPANQAMFSSFDGVDLQKTGRHGNRRSSDVHCVFYGNLPALLRRNGKNIDVYFVGARDWGHPDRVALHRALCQEWNRADSARMASGCMTQTLSAIALSSSCS